MPTFPCPHCRRELESPDEDPARQCPHCRETLLVQDRYLLVDLLGTGQAGAVYLGEDEARNRRRIAVKTLKVSTDLDWQASKSFMRGAKALMTLEHPALPRVYDADEDDHRVIFLVREVLEGGTLAERVEAGTIGAEQVSAMLETLLDVLHLVHSQVPPVFHRDIKPTNIMFRHPDDTAPILVDFDRTESAMAQRTGLDRSSASVWSAPEVGDVKPNASHDLYSLGVTLLYAGTGGRDPEDLAKDDDGELDVPAALPELDKRVQTVLSGLVAHHPKDRFQSAGEAKKALTGEWPKSGDDEPDDEIPADDGNPLHEPIAQRPSQNRGDLTAIIVVAIIAAAVATGIALASRGF